MNFLDTYIVDIPTKAMSFSVDQGIIFLEIRHMDNMASHLLKIDYSLCMDATIEIPVASYGRVFRKIETIPSKAIGKKIKFELSYFRTHQDLIKVIAMAYEH